MGRQKHTISKLIDIAKEEMIRLQYSPFTVNGRVPAKGEWFKELLEKYNVIGVYGEKYDKECIMKCDRFLVQNSKRVISLYDGRSIDETAFALRYAHSLNIEVRKIRI